MKRKLLEILVCPKCKSDLSCYAAQDNLREEILDGALECVKCHKQYAIVNGIPRFVEFDNYASSFGYQWNKFKAEQIDSFNGTSLSANRFYSETQWTKDWLKGKWVLDAGCGAGRFLDVVSQNECEVVGIDISSAIDASQANLENRENVHFVQASIYDLPFRTAIFDACYCIGVIQHTPDPQKALISLSQIVKDDGEFAVTIYENKKWYTRLYSKYLMRPLATKLAPETLLQIIEKAMPVLFPLTSFLFRLPLVGRFFAFVIPVANYVHESALSREQRYAWAVLDTFDMLAPQYDQPQTEADVTQTLLESGMNKIKRLPNPGLNLKAKRTFVSEAQ